MAFPSLLRLVLGSALGAPLASAAADESAQPCGADGTCAATFPAKVEATVKKVVSQDSMLLQVKHNRSAFEVHRSPGDDPAWGYPEQGEMKATGLWCSVHIPPQNWNLKSCPFDSSPANVRINVLTYNLFWWNLFDQRDGSDRSAGKLIATTQGADGYDIMGFQECDDRNRILNDARTEGLTGQWEALAGIHAVSVMYRTDRFTIVTQGADNVGEDDPAQHFGKRGAVWARLRHKTSGMHVFFVNHHGPLPVSWGGGCTGSAAVYNLMRVIATNAHRGDAIILTGDFNAEAHSSRIRDLDTRLHRVFSGTSMGGVDHIFSNCDTGHATTHNLGKGIGQYGSDHDALSAEFSF